MFHDVWERSTRLDERTARRFEELAIERMPSPVLGYLARGSGDSVLLACRAALGVIRRPKTIRYALLFFKNEPSIVVRAKWLHMVRINRLKIRPLLKVA